VADLNKFLGGGTSLKLKDQRDRVREASEDELHDALETAQIELLNLRTQAILHQAANPMRIRQVRKMVARINGELTARANKAA
jgi:large subunit ribosomal protein L29